MYDHVWNIEILESLEANKLAYTNWKSDGRPSNIDNFITLKGKITHL